VLLFDDSFEHEVRPIAAWLPTSSLEISRLGQAHLTARAAIQLPQRKSTRPEGDRGSGRGGEAESLAQPPAQVGRRVGRVRIVERRTLGRALQY
jgi:hypothetical protein